MSLPEGKPPLHHAAFSTAALAQKYPEPCSVPDTGVVWVLVHGHDVIVHGETSPSIYFHDDPRATGAAGRIEYLGHRENVPCYAAELVSTDAFKGECRTEGVRDLWGRIPDADVAVAAFAARMIAFASTNRFCGSCGTKTTPAYSERAKKCPACGLVIYPRISPAIIVLIRRDDKILLARSPRFPDGMYSVLAGFVEPGETLEHAVHREVMEEVGITIKNLQYFASEPWPFPDSLMIAFIAEYAGGNIAIDNNEIAAADWFGRDCLPHIPARMSISRALIEHWIGSYDVNRCNKTVP